jgi:hypothetical protein
MLAAEHDGQARGAACRPAIERKRRDLVHHSREGRELTVHTAALCTAGFAEVGVIWQHGASRLLAAVR